MKYKILVVANKWSLNGGVSVHTNCIEFETKEEASIALDNINSEKHFIPNVSIKAIPLY